MWGQGTVRSLELKWEGREKTPSPVVVPQRAFGLTCSRRCPHHAAGNRLAIALLADFKMILRIHYRFVVE